MDHTHSVSLILLLSVRIDYEECRHPVSVWWIDDTACNVFLSLSYKYKEVKSFSWIRFTFGCKDQMLQQILSERNMISFWNDNNVLFLFSWNQIGKSYKEMKTVLCFFYESFRKHPNLCQISNRFKWKKNTYGMVVNSSKMWSWWWWLSRWRWWWSSCWLCWGRSASVMQVRSPPLSA